VVGTRSSPTTLGDPVSQRTARRAITSLCAAVAGSTVLVLPAGTALAETECATSPSETQEGYVVVDPTCEFRDGSDFTALPGAQLFTGIADGQAYRIEVPESWNGDLVVWSHGFRGEGKEVYVDSPRLREYFIAKGYAWAASSYQTNGYDVQQGVDDSQAMVQRFLDVTETAPGELDRAFIHGASMGGHITAVTLEQHPETWDAGYPVCGVLGDTRLFDFFLGANATAAALTGVELQYPMEPSAFHAAAREMDDGLWDTRPTDPSDQGLAWSGVVQNLTGGPRPGYASAFGFWNSFGRAPYSDVPFLFGVYPGLNPGYYENGVAGNADVQYQIDNDPAVSPEEQALNDAVLRVTADPDQTAVPVITGDPQVPVMSLHDLGDLFVPFSMEQIYAAEAEQNGAPFVSRAIRGTGHCDFTGPELVKGFDDLVRWLDTGYEPAGDPVLNAGAVAAPVFGCRFTNGAHENFTAEQACPTFGDLEGSPHRHAVESLAAVGILTGRDGSFNPSASITRGQVASVIARALGLQPSQDDPRFSDTAGNVHEDAIRAAARAGIVQGYGDGTFRPEQPVARGQLAAMVARALGVDGGMGSGCFEDVEGTTHEAEICALAALGVVTGFAVDDYGPEQPISRAQTASVVWRASL
jgi:pimeloyl-ACP methyl ester carboxylesterase